MTNNAPLLNRTQVITLQLYSSEGLRPIRQVRDGGIAAGGVGKRHHACRVQEIVGRKVQLLHRHTTVEVVGRQFHHLDTEVPGQILRSTLVQ